MNEIIQRDSYPKLSKLRTQLEYLDAVEHNDLEKLREISARYQVSHTPSGSSRFGRLFKVKIIIIEEVGFQKNFGIVFCSFCHNNYYNITDCISESNLRQPAFFRANISGYVNV